MKGNVFPFKPIGYSALLFLLPFCTQEVLSNGVLPFRVKFLLAKGEVYSTPLTERATSVIVVHNHPSRKLEPSREDNEVTDKLWEIGRILGIEMLDHVIFSDEATTPTSMGGG